LDVGQREGGHMKGFEKEGQKGMYRTRVPGNDNQNKAC